MKRVLVALAALPVALGGLLPTAQAGPTAGGITSDDVEYVTFVPFEVGTSTGVSIQGKYMYLTSWKSISIYDISNPEGPQLLGTPFPIGFKFENEQVAVSPNGKFLLFSESLPGDQLLIYDVEDKTNIQEIAALQGAGDHTTSCILKCKWAYGSDGTIVDLRDPNNPKLAADRNSDENWHAQIGLQGGAHDVDEFKNGFLIASPISTPFQYLDVRDPMKPKVLGVGDTQQEGWLFHSGTWPNKGKDKFVLMQGEQNVNPRCDDTNGPFQTYDASKVKKTKTFKLIDTFRVQNGTYADGSPAVNGLGCSAHWFTAHPKFKNGGLVAMGYYEHGTRIFDVSKKGKITEVGWFEPYGGSTSAAYWVNKEIIYAVDYTRGIDVLRWIGKI